MTSNDIKSVSSKKYLSFQYVSSHLLMRYIAVLLFFATMTSFGQKVYEFDHLIDYNFYWDHKTHEPVEYTYLTNSQNNEFTAVLIESDSVTLKLDLLDHKGNHAISYINRELFNSSSSLTIKCSDVRPHSNMKKSLIKRFDLIVQNDTLISGDQLGHYILRSRKNDNTAIEHYIVDISLDRHLPILRHSTAFGRWQRSQNLPNGIISERYLMGKNGKKRHRLVLKEYAVIHKSIRISEDCDYSESE